MMASVASMWRTMFSLAACWRTNSSACSLSTLATASPTASPDSGRLVPQTLEHPRCRIGRPLHLLGVNVQVGDEADLSGSGRPDEDSGLAKGADRLLSREPQTRHIDDDDVRLHWMRDGQPATWARWPARMTAWS